MSSAGHTHLSTACLSLSAPVCPSLTCLGSLVCLPPGEQVSLGSPVMGSKAGPDMVLSLGFLSFSGCLCLGSSETIKGTCRDFWGLWISCLAGSIPACLPLSASRIGTFPSQNPTEREGEGEGESPGTKLLRLALRGGVGWCQRGPSCFMEREEERKKGVELCLVQPQGLLGAPVLPVNCTGKDCLLGVGGGERPSQPERGPALLEKEGGVWLPTLGQL